MMVLPPRAIPQLAERIEQAYFRRRPNLYRECVHTQVWSAAAAVLVALHRSDPSLPIDPELFVACQLEGLRKRHPDPWGELVNPAAPLRYRRQVRRIIQSLRKELRAELRLIDRRCQDGTRLEQILAEANPRVSALARFIAAYRRLGPEATADFHDSVRVLHDACPLYRQACEKLLPPHAYPVQEVLETFAPGPTSSPLFSLN